MRKAQWGALVAVMAIGTFVAMPIAQSGAQEQTQTFPNTVTIEKVIDGTAAAGTIFAVQVNCQDAGLTTVYFNDKGQPSKASGTAITGTNIVGAYSSDICTVTEIEHGGATSVTYACSVDDAHHQWDEKWSHWRASCDVSDRVVTFNDTEGASATVTVTNTIPEPPVEPVTPVTPVTPVVEHPVAAAAVIASARFTG